MADNDSPQTHATTSVKDAELPSAVENIHTSCPVCNCANEHSHDDHSHHGEQDTDTDFPPFRLNYNGIPVNWSQVPRLQQEQYILEELRPGLPEYDKIVAELSRVNIRVTRIERLQNMGLLERFKAEVEDMKKDQGNDSDPNIRYLYHGTSLEKKRLCENGLDQSSSTKDNMGPGLYFSTKPLKCIHYTGQHNQPDVTMILKCRVILDDDQGTPEELTEYVVHEHRRVMVEYLILFEVDDGNADLIAEEAGHDAPDNEHPDRNEAADGEAAVIAEEAGHDAPDNEHPDKDEAADGEGWRPLVMFIVFCSVGYIITPYLIRMVLWALGFTAQGVTKGSIAAKWQSFIGVTRGTWFATAQSTAATGFVSEWTRIIGGKTTDPRDVMASFLAYLRRLSLRLESRIGEMTVICKEERLTSLGYPGPLFNMD